MLAKCLNLAVICLEILGLRISISRRHLGIFAFYTQISNLVTLVSSVAFLLMRGPVVDTLRYLSSCMLLMTFLVTLFVLVPMGGGFKTLMLSGNGIYHHTLCPLLSIVSYVFLEPHSILWLIPVLVTLLYGVILMILNGLGRYDGPYPFFRVRQQSALATVLWTAALIVLISGIALLFTKL